MSSVWNHFVISYMYCISFLTCICLLSRRPWKLWRESPTTAKWWRCWTREGETMGLWIWTLRPVPRLDTEAWETSRSPASVCPVRSQSAFFPFSSFYLSRIPTVKEQNLLQYRKNTLFWKTEKIKSSKVKSTNQRILQIVVFFYM